MTDHRGEFIRALSAPRRVEPDDDRIPHLMRLAGDPLGLHDFLRQDVQSFEVHTVHVRVALYDLATRPATRERFSDRGYGDMDSRTAFSLAPETFAPSQEDREQAMTIDPDLQSAASGTGRHRSPLAAYCLVALMVVVIVTQW